MGVHCPRIAKETFFTMTLLIIPYKRRHFTDGKGKKTDFWGSSVGGRKNSGRDAVFRGKKTSKRARQSLLLLLVILRLFFRDMLRVPDACQKTFAGSCEQVYINRVASLGYFEPHTVTVTNYEPWY